MHARHMCAIYGRQQHLGRLYRFLVTPLLERRSWFPQARRISAVVVNDPFQPVATDRFSPVEFGASALDSA
jgi:hypothetical protein